jgi:tetratricopeptide (TPR) repeat protein
LKCFHRFQSRALHFGAVALFMATAGWMVSARGALPSWIRNIEAGNAIEAAFFRAMSLPGGSVLFRRPPSETRPALSELIKAQPRNADLYSLHALEDEQQLDFTAAESDWKTYAESASSKTPAQIALADFYQRRVRPLDEIKALEVIANAQPEASEELTSPAEQQSWRAFERIFSIIRNQGLGKEVSLAHYRAWLARYPQERTLYPRFLDFLVLQKDYAAANQVVSDYRRQFPDDAIFPVKARAMVEYRRGSRQQGLAVYEQTFQPLWAPELVTSYFDLLTQTQSLRKFADEARAALAADPGDLNATARLFYYYQQQGKLDAAQQTITAFRLHKEAARSEWRAQQLYVCARLLEDIHAYPESARYYFALYNSKGTTDVDAQEQALAGLTSLLLTAPESPIRLGSGELSIYRDIATMDAGPGYLNGILSLILNTSPAARFSEEEQRAIPYFHRSRAAELLAMLDAKFPNSPRRPELHAKLLDFYASSGESGAVIRGGHEFLAAFPNASQRTDIALLMADADARTGKTQEEFAIYDSVLQELAAQAQRMPLGQRVSGGADSPENDSTDNDSTEYSPRASQDAAYGEASDPSVAGDNFRRRTGGDAFQLRGATAITRMGARSPEYSRVLERYLARLVQSKKIPEALAVLRREIDRNPDDPGIYQRLAIFLAQNRLGAEEEEVYRRAMQRFQDRSWYHKLARFYLVHKKNAEFEALTQEAVKTFSGTSLERYFTNVGYGGTPVLYLRLNQFAHQRFPHNPVFVRNLLVSYHDSHTYDDPAWQALIRQHWFEEADLRGEFFEYLSRTRQLEIELAALRQDSPAGTSQWQELIRTNPAAGDFLAQAALWQSHFEEGAPALNALAVQYPADFETARTASAVDRSLAYFDPRQTDAAVKIEDNLLQANPGNTEVMARIGDIYADRELFAKAAPYWNRIPTIAPGQAGGYLEAASIYWDYFDFDNALRLLNEGRTKLSDENLYSYEAGAIYESQRDYPRAVAEYIKGDLAGQANSPADLRLMQLARRPKLRDLVDQQTARLVASPNPPMTAVYLRVRVLEAQDRKPEMESLLDSIATNITSIETAEDVENLATQRSLENVRQHALEKQCALTSDPINRLQLRYRLVQLYENRKDFESAQRSVEALYHENPKIMGVVRSTVDFYWRTKMYSQAIAVLLQASKDAYPDLGKQFTFEAARKSTEAGQYQEARDLLAKLLTSSPYDGEYLAAMADTYARAADDQGLREFYLDKIALFRNAHLSGEDRKTRTASLRRGLIPALTRTKDYAGVVDQYIELINTFPEDSGLVTEAALYSLRYQRQQQLVDFYAKTVTQSPRDYRWPMVLAEIDAGLEQYPAAIESYGKAITVRPDRVDLHEARANLEERLMRFDDAAADYQRVYELAFKDPKWMEKVAEVRARQGRANDVVAALRVALIEGTPETAGKYFEVARRLESWGLLAEARSFAEQGIASAGSDLLATSQQQPGATLYTRIMTRLRQQEKAYATLQSAFSDASSALPVIKQQIAREGIAAVTDREWRERTRENRVRIARESMRAALSEMGSTVATYFTPDERVALARFAESKRAAMSLADVESFAVPLAQSAGLANLEADWRYELMMQGETNSAIGLARMQALVDLQRRRLKFAELASQLEQFAPRIEPLRRYSVWIATADAYRSAGDAENELRVLAAIPPVYVNGDEQGRLFQLLLTRRPQELVQRGANWNAWGQEAANFVVANGDAAMAHALVSSRGRTRTPVWSRAYDSLVGLYVAEPQPAVNSAFLATLGDHTIAERLAKPVDRTQQLAGNVWFYYGSRYGEYLGVTKQGDTEDFFPAELEQSPASPSGYVSVADYYVDSGNTTQAIADYRHALELAPRQADTRDRLALAYYKQGARAEAIAQWKQALAAWQQQLSKGQAPEEFWADFARICDHLHSRRVFPDVRPDVDVLLRAYLRRNGNYRSNALLHSAYLANGDPEAAVTWLLDVSSAAADPATVLADIAEAPWIPLAQHAPIYQRVLQLKQDALTKQQGLEKESAEQSLRAWQVRWTRYLVLTRQYAAASAAIASLSKQTREAEASALVPLELQIAAQTGNIDSTIAGYRADPQTAPASETLRTAARQLFEAGDKQSARKVLEFVFARELDEHRLVAANLLGLAEIRIAAGDTAGAIELLRRLVVAVGNPFENLDPAAALLEKTGHNAEAVEFLAQLVQSAPWDPMYRLRLAKAIITAGKNAGSAQDVVMSIATSPQIPYTARTQAALTLAGSHDQSQHGAIQVGSNELNLLASGTNGLSASAANHPFFYEARLRAAQASTEPSVKLQLLGNALADTPTRDDARIPLFLAAASARSDQFARGVIEPLVRAQFQGNIPPMAITEDEIFTAETDAAATEGVPNWLSTPLKLSPAQQSQVAGALTEVLIRTNQLSQALSYLQITDRLEKVTARRHQVANRIAVVRLQLRRRQLNEARQPILHEALEQDRLVHPKLPLPTPLTGSAPPAKTDKKGVSR